MIISISEFNDNISYYIDLARKEPIKLTKRGIIVAVIISKNEFDIAAKRELDYGSQKI